MERRIIIVGEPASGKTTLAKKLSKEMQIKMYSTDDFFWKKKFTEIKDREQSIKDINEVYKKDSWIVEGTTIHLIRPGLEKADKIYYLESSSALKQNYLTIKRFFIDKTTIKSLFTLLKDLNKKRKIYRKYIKDILELYKNKVIQKTNILK